MAFGIEELGSRLALAGYSLDAVDAYGNVVWFFKKDGLPRF
jgi:hypothetical protein